MRDEREGRVAEEADPAERCAEAENARGETARTWAVWTRGRTPPPEEALNGGTSVDPSRDLG